PERRDQQNTVRSLLRSDTPRVARGVADVFDRGPLRELREDVDDDRVADLPPRAVELAIQQARLLRVERTCLVDDVAVERRRGERPRKRERCREEGEDE